MNDSKPNLKANELPKLRKGVILHSSTKGLHILVSPYRSRCEKLCLISPKEFSFLRLCNGRKGLEEIATLLSLPLNDIEKIKAKWADKEYGVFENGEDNKEKSKTDKNAKYRKILHRLKQEWISARAIKGSRHDVTHYHKVGIKEALHQFERVEVTVSHAYSKPHSALTGLTYGERFADLLMERNELKGRVLEVGGGTGLLARHLLDRFREKRPQDYSHISYTLVDVSPELLEAQRKELSSHTVLAKFLEGNVEEGFPEGLYNLIMMNEMIADLSVVKLQKVWLQEDYSGKEIAVKETIEIIKEFQIKVDDAPSPFLINIGAIKVLIGLKEHLVHGGKAYVVEYGEPNFYPKRVGLQGHAEHSIHFGHLFNVARTLGLNPKLEKLSDFLDFDSKVDVIQRDCLHYLKDHLLAFVGRELPARAYTKKMLQEQLDDFDQFVNIDFRKIGSGESFMDPGGFWVLSMSLP